MGPLLIAGVATQAVGGIVNAYASYKAGQVARDRARANAEVIRLDAQDALAQGEQSAMEVGKQVRGVVGAQASSYAAQGVKIDTGSAALTADESLAAAGVDVVRLRREARKHFDNLNRQANDMEQQGEEAYSAGRFSAVGSILSAGGSAAAQAGK